jgi:hypothetical protein
MSRTRIAILALAVALAIAMGVVFAGAGNATHYYSHCRHAEGWVAAQDWLQTTFSNTSKSTWAPTGSGSSYGYTAERIKPDGTFSYYLNIENGGYFEKDFYPTSAERKTSAYNWYNTQWFDIDQLQWQNVC